MDIKELKSRAYDCISQIEYWQNELRKIQVAINDYYKNEKQKKPVNKKDYVANKKTKQV